MNSKKTVAFLDIGTNSIRILIVTFLENRSWIVLTDQKMIVRLGEGEFDTHHLTPDAMTRAETVLFRFVHMAQSFGAEEIIAIATSALRDADNKDTFIQRIHANTGVWIQIISGPEEARLIWLGVSRGYHLNKEKALFIDIGGGSTEIIVGDQFEPQLLRSLKLGAIRTTQAFIPSGFSDPMPEQILTVLRSQIDLRIAHTIRNLKQFSLSRGIGSSGTIMTLETIARHYKETMDAHVEGILTLKEIEKIINLLGEKTLEERKKIEGLNPERADIIIPGAIILERILYHTELDKICVTERGLRDGLLEEYLINHSKSNISPQYSIRTRSVLEMGERFHIKTRHALHIQNLSLMLYDSAKKIGLIQFPDNIRELLSFAAYLHDIGQFISYSGHHYHSYYLISSSDLLGFTQDELCIISLITRYHRKKGPRLKDKQFSKLNRKNREIVKVLSMVLRIAENLDRSHDGRVLSAQFTNFSEERIYISINCPDDCSLEYAAIYNDMSVIQRTLSRELILTIYQNVPDPVVIKLQDNINFAKINSPNQVIEEIE